MHEKQINFHPSPHKKKIILELHAHLITLTSVGEVRVALVTFVALAEVADGVIEAAAVPMEPVRTDGGRAGAVAAVARRAAVKIPRARGVPGARLVRTQLP